MPYELLNGHRESLKVGGTSALAARVPVTLGATVDQVVAAGTNGAPVLGFNDTATAPLLTHTSIYGDNNVVKAIAGASLGYGAEVGIASTNGALGPVAGASGVMRYSVGVARENAAAAEIFAVYVKPRQVSGSA